MFGGEGCGGGGTDFGEGIGRDGGNDVGTAGIDEEVGGLDTLGNRNELHTEGLGFLIEARHGKEDTIGGVQVRAIRENYAGIPVTKGDFEGRDQLSGIY